MLVTGEVALGAPNVTFWAHGSVCGSVSPSSAHCCIEFDCSGVCGVQCGAGVPRCLVCLCCSCSRCCFRWWASGATLVFIGDEGGGCLPICALCLACSAFGLRVVDTTSVVMFSRKLVLCGYRRDRRRSQCDAVVYSSFARPARRCVPWGSVGFI